jgi:hypothetical protein
MYRLTEYGQQRFADYINVLERVIADAHVHTNDQRDASRQGLSRGWSPA